jgi:cell division protease FtsH
MVALQSGFVESATIELETTAAKGQVDDLGRTDYRTNERIRPGERFLAAKIRTALAGMVAEEVILEERSIGSGGIVGSDIEVATKVATLMAASYGLGGSLRFDAPSSLIDAAYGPKASDPAFVGCRRIPPDVGDR